MPHHKILRWRVHEWATNWIYIYIYIYAWLLGKDLIPDCETRFNHVHQYRPCRDTRIAARRALYLLDGGKAYARAVERRKNDEEDSEPEGRSTSEVVCGQFNFARSCLEDEVLHVEVGGIAPF